MDRCSVSPIWRDDATKSIRKSRQPERKIVNVSGSCDAEARQPEESIIIGLLILLFVLGLVGAHLLGRRIAARLTVRPGHIRRLMPTLPLRHDDRRPGWEKRLRAAEETVIEALLKAPKGVEASPLAAQIGEDRDVVQGVLEHLRQEVPCDLRVTRSGRLLHDFDPAELAELSRKRNARRPFIIGIYLMGLLANLGAAWPVILILFIAVSTLQQVAGGQGDFIHVGLVGIGMLFSLVVATLLFGGLMHMMLTPTISGPTLGQAVLEEAAEPRLENDRAWWLFWMSSNTSTPSSGWTSSGSSSSRSRNSNDKDKGGAAQLILIVILVAIILACLFTLFVWMRGIWRAISQRRLDLEWMTPTAWVREREDVDLFERYMPTNDVVGRTWRSMRRYLTRRRPQDADLGPRILVYAKRRGGAISGFEIAMLEGLSPSEAVELGARLCAELGGEIRAVDGEVIFDFPGQVFFGVRAMATDPDLWAEYFTFNQDGPALHRKPDQDINKIPVNLVGLRVHHLSALSRLAAGAWMMAISGWILCVAQVPVEWNLYLMNLPLRMAPFHASWGLLIGLALSLFAFAATALAAVARYAARAEAILGTRRDARRAAYQELVERCKNSDSATIDLAHQADRIGTELSFAWRGVDADLYNAEMIGVAADLDLEPADRLGRWQIGPLRARLQAVESIDVSKLQARAEGDDDPVVYSTRSEIDRIDDLI